MLCFISFLHPSVFSEVNKAECFGNTALRIMQKQPDNARTHPLALHSERLHIGSIEHSGGYGSPLSASLL
jgi:hypothetical protein